VGAFLNGYHADAARTFPVGEISPEAQKLIDVTKECFFRGANAALAGNRLGDIGFAVQSLAEENGYGVVMPTVEEMNLEEPVLVKNGGSYGVKLKASAPSLHIMKVDASTEVAPIVGTERQGEDLINFIMNKFEDNPAGIWETNMFGRSLHDLVNEGLNGKLTSMPKEAQGKMRKTLTRIVNENRGGIICILL
jgi:hypothetical protein